MKESENFMPEIFIYVLIKFIYFEIILLCLSMLLTSNKHKSMNKFRENYIKFAINLNKNILLVIIKIIKKILYITASIIKYLFNLVGYKTEIKKLSFDEFCDGIRCLTANEFEEFTASLYSGLGYKVKLMPVGPDGGKDIILKQNNERIYVECKRYLKSTVGREICQKLIGAAMNDCKVKKTILFTCGKIHKNAYNYEAELNNANRGISLEIVNIKKMYDLYTQCNATNEQLKLIR